MYEEVDNDDFYDTFVVRLGRCRRINISHVLLLSKTTSNKIRVIVDHFLSLFFVVATIRGLKRRKKNPFSDPGDVLNFNPSEETGKSNLRNGVNAVKEPTAERRF